MTLTEIKEMERNDAKEFWMYYYYVKALRVKEARQMKDMEHDVKKESQKHKTVPFPKDFISQVKEKVVNLEE